MRRTGLAENSEFFKGNRSSALLEVAPILIGSIKYKSLNSLFSLNLVHAASLFLTVPLSLAPN